MIIGKHAYGRARLLLFLFLPLAAFYFLWLLRPERIGQPVLYGILVVAELFNVTQALGFWWTCAHDRPRRTYPRRVAGTPIVDVLIPRYNEPVDIVEPTIAAATRIRGAEVRVALLDDGDSPEMAALARRHGVRYLARPSHEGAKAGNLNHALASTSAELVVVFDCDHVPDPRFLELTLPKLRDPRVAFVQTPQYYANEPSGGVAGASWGQQALFFGPISRGKSDLGAMFCCGTNMVFRRAALEDIEGFPEGSLTEDFEMSIVLHERGWSSAYVPVILARGLGPEDIAAYSGQQNRWARGCLSSIPRILKGRLPVRMKLQYLLSSMFFLTGWSIGVYVSLPVIRLVTGMQPLAAAASDQFLLHFAPYFGLGLTGVALFGAGVYTFDSFALMSANFWVHIRALLAGLLRRPGHFEVTPKKGAGARQLRAVAPTLTVVVALAGASLYGLSQSRAPSTWNNVAFAMLHTFVLLNGAWPALVKRRETRSIADPRLKDAPLVRRQPADHARVVSPSSSRDRDLVGTRQERSAR